MKHFHRNIAVLVAAILLLMATGIQSISQAGDNDKYGDKYGDWGKKEQIWFRAELIGYEEVPAVSSTGSGKFRAKANRDGTSFDYEISYQNLEGNVTQSHIHFGQKTASGGISIWLCQTTTNPSPVATTPACTNPNDPLDTHSGTVTGTATAADVIGPAGQGIAATEFAEILQAMRDGIAYANVHSSRNPGGEIRGQIK